MGDLKNKNAIVAKGFLFLILGLIASGTLLLLEPNITIAILLLIAVWAFCRFYYFAFYVIEHYVDSEYRFSGLYSFLCYLRRYLAGRKHMSLASHYTDRVRDQIDRAKQLARDRSSVGPEHLFLCVCHDGVANHLFKVLNVDLKQFQQDFDATIPIVAEGLSSRPPFSTKAAQVLDRSAAIAQSLNNPYLCDEHIILALADVPSPVSDFMQRNNITFDKLREALLALLGIDPEAICLDEHPKEQIE